MAKRILVALDRTTPLPALLDLVVNAAAGGGATVRLLRVAPFPSNLVDADDRVVAYSDQEAARVEAEILDELRTVELCFGEMPVDSAVRFGDPVREILAEADAFDADLIAMATRWRPATGRPTLGSVAEEVGRRARTAVALVRAER
jgi:nucleotide-binding universal stress UspA family protein